MNGARAIALIAALAPAIGGCGNDGVILRPVLDLPPDGSEAYPFGAFDTFSFSIARVGDDNALLERQIPFGDPLTLDPIPVADGLVYHLSGLVNGGEIAYGRTCPFNITPEGPTIDDPHLYFSRIVKWGVGPVPGSPGRKDAAAWALPDGSAAFAGGLGDNTIERFDPLGTGRFRTLDGTVLDRTGAVLTPLDNAPGDDPRALLIGGIDSDGAAVPLIEVLAPTRATVIEPAVDGPALVGHAAATLVDGSVVVIGGRTQARPVDPLMVSGEVWLLTFGDGGVLDAPRRLAVQLGQPRELHTATRLGNGVGADVLIIGGRDGSGDPVARAELYRPLRETVEPLPSALLQIPRWSHAAVRLPGGFILVVGGYTKDLSGATVRVADLELYDPVQGTFSLAGVLPVGAGLTDMSVTPLPDGRVLLAGGLDADGNAVNTALIARLDPFNGQVDISVTNPLDTPRAGHNAVVLCDGTVMVVGGSDVPDLPAERYNPPSADRR